MPESVSASFGIALIAIERPHCPNCQTRMTLTGIASGPAGYDFRTFECSKCDHISSLTVANDPTKYGAAQGWIAGELKPPSKS